MTSQLHGLIATGRELLSFHPLFQSPIFEISMFSSVSTHDIQDVLGIVPLLKASANTLYKTIIQYYQYQL